MGTYVHMGVFNTLIKYQSNAPFIRNTVQQWHNFAVALQYVKQSMLDMLWVHSKHRNKYFGKLKKDELSHSHGKPGT